MEQQVLKMKESFWYLPQYVTRDSDFLSAFTASSVWELLFPLSFFWRWLMRILALHVRAQCTTCTSAWINPHYTQGHPAWYSFIAFTLFVMASQHQSCCQLIDLICLSHHLFYQVLNLQQKSAVNAQLKIWDLLSTCAPPDLFWHHTPFLVCIMKVADDTRL